MKTVKAEIRIGEEGFNDMPSKAVIEALLEKIEYGLKIIDLPDKSYWQNCRDTIVFQIDGDEVNRFGGKAIADTIFATNQLIAMSHPDELHNERKGAKVIYRLWWD